MDEARKVIERLERIEALQSTQAPAEELLGEVRLLLHEGELLPAGNVPVDAHDVPVDVAVTASDGVVRLGSG